MSARGSFVTEYLSCAKCFEACRQVLCQADKFLRGVEIPTWNPQETGPLPIVAGKIGGLAHGGELDDFEHEYGPRLATAICHPVTVAVLGESYFCVFEVRPGEQVMVREGGPLHWPEGGTLE